MTAHFPGVVSHTLHNFLFCNLFIFKEKQRQIQIQKKHMTSIYNLHRQKTFNL
jgi:hypothetical protein